MGDSELYAARGAGVLRPRARGEGEVAERRSLLLLGGSGRRRLAGLHAATGLVLEPAALGSWIVGEAGAVLVRRTGMGLLLLRKGDGRRSAGLRPDRASAARAALR